MINLLPKLHRPIDLKAEMKTVLNQGNAGRIRKCMKQYWKIMAIRKTREKQTKINDAKKIFEINETI